MLVVFSSAWGLSVSIRCLRRFYSGIGYLNPEYDIPGGPVFLFDVSSSVIETYGGCLTISEVCLCVEIGGERKRISIWKEHSINRMLLL